MRLLLIVLLSGVLSGCLAFGTVTCDPSTRTPPPNGTEVCTVTWMGHDVTRWQAPVGE